MTPRNRSTLNMVTATIPAIAPVESPVDFGGGGVDVADEGEEEEDEDEEEREEEVTEDIPEEVEVLDCATLVIVEEVTPFCPNLTGNSTTPTPLVQHEAEIPQHHLVLVDVFSQGVTRVVPTLFRVVRHSLMQSGLEKSEFVQRLSQYSVTMFPPSVRLLKHIPLSKHTSAVSPNPASPPEGTERFVAQQVVWTGSLAHGTTSAVVLSVPFGK